MMDNFCPAISGSCIALAAALQAGSDYQAVIGVLRAEAKDLRARVVELEAAIKAAADAQEKWRQL